MWCGAALAFAGTPGTARVRSTSPAILALIAEGRARSATFAALVDELDRSRGVVYVEFGLCEFGHVDGCVLPVVGGAGADRYLRILITSAKKRRSHDQVLALLAHELRHALEVFEHPEVVDRASLEAMYRRIGSPANVGGSGYETPAATAAGDTVLKELSQAATTASRRQPVGYFAISSRVLTASLKSVASTFAAPGSAGRDA